MARSNVLGLVLGILTGFPLAACAVEFGEPGRDYPYPWNQRVGYETTVPQTGPIIPGFRESWYRPSLDKQRPYVPRPQKRFIPLGGDSRGPVIILPGGNGPQ